MIDLIRIKGLRIPMRIGVSEAERSEPRPIMIDVEIRTDTSVAGKTDDLADTVDYGRTISQIVEAVADEHVRLLEHLAERIGELILNTPHVESVAVEVSKESPPIEADVDAVTVRIERP
jgi:dihydroneopterin aldolase